MSFTGSYTEDEPFILVPLRGKGSLGPRRQQNKTEQTKKILIPVRGSETRFSYEAERSAFGRGSFGLQSKIVLARSATENLIFDRKVVLIRWAKTNATIVSVVCSKGPRSWAIEQPPYTFSQFKLSDFLFDISSQSSVEKFRGIFLEFVCYFAGLTATMFWMSKLHSAATKCLVWEENCEFIYSYFCFPSIILFFT